MKGFKKIGGLLAAAGFLLLLTAALGAAGEGSRMLALNGVLLDKRCADAHTGDIFSYIKSHPKECALSAEGQASGYCLLTPDGIVTAFDPKSNEKIAAFLRKTNSKLSVTVKARLAGEQLQLVGIENYRPAKKGSPAKK
jgi:hypothetical protein